VKGIQLMTTDFSEYTVVVGSDRAYYGAGCSDDDAIQYANKLLKLIHDKFTGINASISQNGRLTGPDSNVVCEIRQWIEDNWLDVFTR